VYQIDGMTVQSGIGNGTAAQYYNDGQFEEYTYTTSAIPAEVAYGGVRIQMTSREGSNAFRGYALGQYAPWQSNNYSSDLQAAGRLRPVLVAVRAALDGASAGGQRVPLLVKIAPDLADAEVDAVADLALELGLDGIIATNTTVSRDGLASSPAEVAAAGAGGLSGPPLRARALAVLVRLRARAGDRLVLIAAGGIETPDDAWERLRAGATLVQAYTGFIYGGPLWPRRMHAGLARRARAAGLSSIGDVS